MKICIATPCSGELTTEYFFGALSCMKFPKEKAEFDFFIYEGGSLLSKSRDKMVAEFLNEPLFAEHDYLVFIDSDQSFTAVDVYRMAMHGVDFVAAPVPYKKIHLDNIVLWSSMCMDKSEEPDYDAMLPATSDYNFHNIIGESKENRKLMEVESVGTGMMCMSRYGLLTMQDMAIQEGVFDVWDHDSGKKAAALFACMVKEGRYLGEDFSFCERVRMAGFKMHLDPFINVNHVGKMVFHGNLSTRRDHVASIKEFIRKHNSPNN